MTPDTGSAAVVAAPTIPPITVFTESDIRQAVTPDREALAVVEEAFSQLARGEATVPPIMAIEIPEHRCEIDVKTAYLHGLEGVAVKIASGSYDNPALGLPTSSGMMIVVSTRTGFPEAVLLDNGYLTAVRTAVAGAIAAKYLARPRIETVGVIGTGLQGRRQVQALLLVRDFRRVLAYDQDRGALSRYVTEMSNVLARPVTAADDVAAVVRESDLVVTSTPSRRAYLKAEWLHAGLHITAMGADAPEKQELEADVFGRADRVACDLKSQCFIRGELHHALERKIISASHDIVELGELTSGRKPGRSRDDQITICDLTGVGVQDTAIALLACRKAGALGLGTRFGTNGTARM